MRRLYQRIASALQAVQNCKKNGNTEWEHRHHETIEALVRHYMPSGGGIDSGTVFDFEKSKPNRLVFSTAYHHMNDIGMYDGWTEHKVIVTPDLASGFEFRITGRDRRDIKDYLGEVFHTTLNLEIDQDHYTKACA